MKKKLSFILAICMLFTCLTPYSLAADTTEAALVEQFNNIATVAEMRAFLEENADSLSLDLSKYSALSDTMKMQVAAKLIGNTADSVAQIKQMFDEVVAESFATQSSPSSPSYGGGGGISFGEEITQSGTCGDSVEWALGESGTLYIYGSGAMDDYATTSEIPWYSYKTQITGVEVLDGVTYIGNRAFRDTYVKTAKFAGTVTATGTSVFNSCSKLAEVDLGGNISHLNNYVLYNCDALKSIDLEGVKTVGSNTFASCGVLASVSFYKEIESIGASAFASNAKLSDLYYEGTAEEWANVTIASGNTYLTALTPRGTVEGTCGSNLSWMIRGNTLVISGTGAMTDFASTSAIPWYSYKSIIEKVTIEEGITYIGNRAFRDLPITEVTIPEGVTSTGTSIFNSCAKLEKATLPSTLKTLANYTFYNCDALVSIELPYVTSIGANAFATCGALEEITVSTALKSVGASAFASSTKLADIYYDGTETQWSKITVSSGNTPFTSATVNYADIPENIVAFGDCGDSLAWVIDTDGLLTISGTGKMTDFATTSEIPWYAYKSQIKSLEIEEGITYIGNRAFRDLSITEATIPEGVTSTGSSIFNNCIKLAKVTLPSTLKAIAGYTFYNCDALTSVELPYVTSIGANAFTSCSVLTEITLGTSFTSVGASAFASSTKLSDVYYDGTEKDWASVSVASGNDPLNNATFHFAEDEEVITITQPDNLRYKYGQPIDLTGVVIESSKLGVILEVTGEYSVTGYNPLITAAQDITVTCNGLSAVITVAGFNPFITGKQTGTISYGGVSISVEIEIVKLTAIEITSMPSKLEYIEGEELDLTGLVVEAVHSDNNREAVTDYTVSGYDASVLGEQTITVTYEDQTATFTVTVAEKSGTCGENVTWTLDENGLLTISGTGAMADYSDATDVPWYSYREKIISVVIENGVTATGYRAFYGCINLTSVEISDSVTLINKYTFYDCDSLSSVKLGSGVITINRWAFADCDSLTSVEIPSSVTTISDYAFENSDSITDVYYDGTESDWNSKVTVGGTNNDPLVNATFHFAGPAIIASGDCGENATYTLDENGLLTISGTGAMYDYKGDLESASPFLGTSAQKVVIESGITHIGKNAFKNGEFTTIEIPDSVKTIGELAFYNCANLTSVEIPDGVTTIGYSAFYSCDSLTDVKIPSGVTEISENLFNNCFNLASIKIPESVITIKEFAFYNCFSLTSIEIPDSVTTIGYDAFAGCSKVETVTIGSGVSEIGVRAFSYSGSLKSISVSENNANYCSIDGNLFTKDKTTLIQYVVGNGNTTYEIPDGVTTIGENAFNDCSLESITIPNSVTAISPNAFLRSNSDDYIVADVYYNGTESEWNNNVFVDFGNDSLLAGTFHFEEEPVVLMGLEVVELGKTEYFEGEELDLTGLVVEAIYSDGSRNEVTNYSVSGYDATVLGEQVINVAYHDAYWNYAYTTFTVTVVEYPDPTPTPELAGIHIVEFPRTEFMIGEPYDDAAGIVIMAYYSDGSEVYLNPDEYIVDSSNYFFEVEGSYEIIVEYMGFTESFYVNVIMTPGPIDNTISSIMIETLPEKLTYQVGEELDLTGMVVQAVYMDGTMMEITSECVAVDFDSSTSGNYWVNIEYMDPLTGMPFVEGFEIEVIGGPIPEPTFVSIEIESNPLQTNYIVGEELNLEGLKVNAVYSDGSREEITEYSISGYDMSMSGEQTVIVSYQGFEAYFGITVDVAKATFNVEHYQEAFDGTYIMYESGAYGAEVGATITAADYVKEFDGFTADLALSSDVVVSIDGTATVKIYYARNSYDVVYDFGEAGGSYTSSHKYGTNMDLAEPTVTAPEGKYFAGWADAEGNLISSLTVPAYDITIYAQWAEIEIPVTKYTVTFVDWDGTELKTQEVAEGEAATAPENPSREGYNFMGWDKDFSNVTSDMTVTAMYDKYILDSGACGDDINWTLYASGVLSLAGSGAMYDYTYGGEAPWYEYHSEILFVQIESGITTIGAYAFYNCENLTSVATLENITSIGEHAFDGCVSLADISVPDSAYVGEGAFKGCTSLTQIPIPGDRTEIGEGEFEGYDSMTAVVIPEGVTSIGARAFLNCLSIETVSLPSTLTTIDEDAFAGCSSIKYVYYNGTKTDFEKINISSGNDVILENIHFFKFTVVFKDYDGNNLSEQIVNVGEDAVAPEAPSKEGYTFTGWSNGYTNVTEDLVIWAQYDKEPDPEMVTYTIQYYQETAIDSGNYNISTSETTSDYPGIIVTISPYVPDGFELNTELSELTKTIAEDGSTIFKVYYDKVSEPEPIVTYTVTFITQFGDIIGTQTVYEGYSALLPEAPEVPGYAFSGWDGEYRNITKDTTVTALYVVVAPTVYEVTFIGFNGGVFDTKTATAGGTVIIPAAPIVDGYEFGGWFTGENGTGTQFGYGSVVNGNLTLYAYYYEAVTVVGIEVTKLPSKTQYYIGEALNTSGMIVVIKYSDGSTKETSSYGVSTLDSSTVGTKEITVAAEGYSKKFYVTVIENPVEGTPTITVSTVTGQVGNTIEVNISISDNPGIASMLLNLHYDSNYLTLAGVTDGGILGGNVHSDDLEINPYILTWANDTATENITANGVIATLAFEVAEDTPTGSYPISVSFDNDNYDIFDINLNTVDFATADGGILIIDHIIGDVNGDGSVNTLDRAVLSRYLSKWVGYEDINLKAADVNADGKVNTLDRAILSRYLSKWTGYETLPYTK